MNNPTQIVEGTLTGTAYWNEGKDDSRLYKSGRVAILYLQSKAADDAIPSQTMTKIGTVSFKPTKTVSYVLPGHTGTMRQIQIDAAGNVNCYNYESSSAKLNVVNALVYFTND